MACGESMAIPGISIWPKGSPRVTVEFRLIPPRNFPSLQRIRFAELRETDDANREQRRESHDCHSSFVTARQLTGNGPQQAG